MNNRSNKHTQAANKNSPLQAKVPGQVELADLKAGLEDLLKRAPSLTNDALEDAKANLIDQVAAYKKTPGRMHKNRDGRKIRPIHAAVLLGGFWALRQHFRSFFESNADITYENCGSPNVWCYEGPDGQGTQRGERCCPSGECTGPGGYEERP